MDIPQWTALVVALTALLAAVHQVLGDVRLGAAAAAVDLVHGGQDGGQGGSHAIETGTATAP